MRIKPVIDLKQLSLTRGEDTVYLAGADPNLFNWLALYGLNAYFKTFGGEEDFSVFSNILLRDKKVPNRYNKNVKVPKALRACQLLSTNVGEDEEALIWWNGLSEVEREKISNCPEVRAILYREKMEKSNPDSIVSLRRFINGTLPTVDVEENED